ncbi:hypothetical protein P8452_33816 [Trifolium repens]|nr:hypothetical protein P8452_33816 [Trifolium repens]
MFQRLFLEVMYSWLGRRWYCGIHLASSVVLVSRGLGLILAGVPFVSGGRLLRVSACFGVWIRCMGVVVVFGGGGSEAVGVVR